jgi:hypothetical protein
MESRLHSFSIIIASIDDNKSARFGENHVFQFLQENHIASLRQVRYNFKNTMQGGKTRI